MASSCRPGSARSWRYSRAGLPLSRGAHDRPHRREREPAPGWRATSSRIGRGFSQLGPPSASIGARFAFESGRGSTTVAARTALASAIAAVAVVVGALTFGANLTRLAEHPNLQGWNWDVAVGNPHSDDVAKTAVPLLDHNPTIAAFSAIAAAGGNESANPKIDGHDAPLFAIDTRKGPNLVPYSAGRAPRDAHEIAFSDKDHPRPDYRIGVSACTYRRAARRSQ